MLLAWFPHRPGLAVACGQTAFGLGTVFLTEIFSWLIGSLNHATSIFLASSILSVSAILPTVLMRWPSEGEVLNSEELEPLHVQPVQVEKMPWPRLLRLPNFWLYLFAVFSTSCSYMLNPYFFKIGMLFNQPFNELVMLFNVTNVASLICALFCTSLTDVLSYSGFWFSGAKNLMIVFMLMQAFLMFMVILVNNAMQFWAFMVVKALLKIIMTCHVGYAAILARDLFGKNNSCVVFGFGAGLALGCGEASSAWLMAAVEAMKGTVSLPSDYNPFYWMAGIWSSLGLLCTILVDKHNSKELQEPFFDRGYLL